MTETHRGIILQIEQKPTPPPTHTHTPLLHPSPSCLPSVSSLLSFYTQLYTPPLCIFIFRLPTFTQLRPVWSSDTWGVGWGGQIRCLSLPAVAFNQWKSDFGDEQRGSWFFHELLHNRITQPERLVPRRRDSALGGDGVVGR